MDLLGIRTQFIQWSGRYDLVSDHNTFADNGADNFIREGQKFLDERVNEYQIAMKDYREVDAGAWYVVVDEVREIHHVYVRTNNDRRALIRYDLVAMVEKYPNKISDYVWQLPEDYCFGVYRGFDQTTVRDTLGEYFDTAINSSLPGGATYQLRTIGFMHPIDVPGLIEVWGMFNANRLEIDTSESYWTRRHPALLTWAALYILEVSMRNTQGANDWLRAINDKLLEFDKSYVQEDIVNKRMIRDV